MIPEGLDRGALSATSPDSIKPATEGSGDGTLTTPQEFEKQQRLDPNIPLEELHAVEATLEAGDAKKGSEIEAELVENDSPGPEVDAVPKSLEANTMVL
ncbi:hypothetical protein DL771_002506 [Monosporascus sp. 5C6A]|nr:hypothetical protein DL771_002506 [Monosporascus sp. 5C6A]